MAQVPLSALSRTRLARLRMKSLPTVILARPRTVPERRTAAPAPVTGPPPRLTSPAPPLLATRSLPRRMVTRPRTRWRGRPKDHHQHPHTCSGVGSVQGGSGDPEECRHPPVWARASDQEEAERSVNSEFRSGLDLNMLVVCSQIYGFQVVVQDILEAHRAASLL